MTLLSKDLQRIDAMRITIAIDDPEFALMSIHTNFRWEEVEVPHVPVDVIVYCLQLQKKGKGEPR